MKINIDQSRCQGHAMCYSNAPAFFVLNDDGYIAMDGDVTVPEALEAAVLRGVGACPERVLTIVPD